MSKQKILLVEDSVETQVVIRATLGKKYDVVIAQMASEALQLVGSDHFALILLDVELPDGNGFQLYSELKSKSLVSDAPIIFLTGRKETSDKVLGFTLGAEDYVVKPIEPLEFQARIDSRIRKSIEARVPKTKFVSGPFEIDLANQSAFIKKVGQVQELDLTSNEFKLLYQFLTHESQVLSREQILEQIWGKDVHITDRTIDTHVYTLRQKLGDLASLIQSVPRVGYKYSPTLATDKEQK